MLRVKTTLTVLSARAKKSPTSIDLANPSPPFEGRTCIAGRHRLNTTIGAVNGRVLATKVLAGPTPPPAAPPPGGPPPRPPCQGRLVPPHRRRCLRARARAGG